MTEEEDGPPPFRQVFEAADHRGLGTLPPFAFRRCLLEGLGLDLTEAECEALLEYLVGDVVVRKHNSLGSGGGPIRGEHAMRRGTGVRLHHSANTSQTVIFVKLAL